MKTLNYFIGDKTVMTLLLFQCCTANLNNQRGTIYGTYESAFSFFQLVNYKFLNIPGRVTPIMSMVLSYNQSFKFVSCGRDLTGTWILKADTLHLNHDFEIYHVPPYLTYRNGKWCGKAYYNNRQIMYSFKKNETQE